MRLPIARLAGAAACLVALTSCGAAPQPEVVETPPTTFAAAAGSVDDFYGQSVDWGSCDGFGEDPLSADLQCGRVRVPIDYAAPGGAVASIAISRVQARGDRLGSILVNPGGPGASGLSSATIADGTGVADSFDMVGFDPRGIGASTPSVTCRTGEETDAQRADDDTDVSPAGIAQTEKENEDYARQCADRTGTDVLAHVGSQDVARDMDVIRSALGDEKLNYIGFSYGTRIGSTYAELFPTRVRAMVLDGALDPNADPVDEIVGQATGFQAAFDAFAADCARTTSCPLGTSAAGAVERYRQLVNPLIEQPARTNDSRGLSYDDANIGVQQALYSPSLWRSLRTGLTQLASGRGDVLLTLADLYEGRRDDGTYSNLDDAFNAVRCVDDPPITDRAEADELDTRFRQAAPFLDDGLGAGAAPLDVCAFWSVPSVGEPHAISAPGLAPTVVVSTTRDPATPYEAGVKLAAALGGSLVTFDGTQHTAAFSGDKCLDDPLTDYLVSLTLPAPGLTC